MVLLINKEGVGTTWPPMDLLSGLSTLEQLHKELLSPGPGRLWQSEDLSSWCTQWCLGKDPRYCCSKGLKQGQLGSCSGQGLGLGPPLCLGFWEGLACTPGACPQWATLNVAE